MDEEGLLLSLIYVPNMVDAQGHYAEADTVRDMAHGFAREGMRLDINHERRPLDKSRAYVAESFIVQPGDPRFSDWKDTQGNRIDATGGWGMAIQLVDETLRKNYREGGWDGTSLYAHQGEYELIEEATPKAASAALDLNLKKTQNDMTPEELAAALALANKPVLARLEALEKAAPDPKDEEIAALKLQLEGKGKPEDKPMGKSEAPKLPSDVTDTKAMAKYQGALAVHELQQSHDLTTSEGLAKFQDELAKLNEDPEEEAYEYTPRAGAAMKKGMHFVSGDGLSKAESEAIDASIRETGNGFDNASAHVSQRQHTQA